jgi:transcriptional regulator with XRE-family HTH domain
MLAVELHRIRVDGETQPRAAIDPATVDEYAEAMARRMRFPPLVVYFDGESAWLADGFHRYYAAQKLGAQALDVDWREGTLEMAKLYAASANAEHGLRRTAGDKRRAIEMVLSTKAGRNWTQEQIAKHCHVSQSWVSTVVTEYRTDKGPKKGPPPTKGERKRATIDAAIQTDPETSDRRLARALGVDRKTVGRARERSKPRERVASAPPPLSHEYSTAAARDVAASILGAARIASMTWNDSDWDLLVEQWGEVVAQREFG